MTATLGISGRLVGNATSARITPTSEEPGWQIAFPAAEYTETHVLVPAETAEAREKENDDNDDNDDEIGNSSEQRQI